MRKNNDQFADLFSIANKGKVNQAKLSLSERHNLSEKSTRSTKINNNTSWSGLDLLEGQCSGNNGVSSLSGSSSASISHSLANTPISDNNIQQQTEIDIFDIFNAPSKTATPIKAPTPTKATVSNSNPRQKHESFLLDDEFTDAFQEEIKPSPTPSSASSTLSQREQKFPSRSRSSVFSDNNSSASLPSTNTRNKQNKRDEIIAELVNMGFPIQMANEAVDSTGDDLQAAVNFIMNQAVGGSRPASRKATPSSNGATQSHSRLKTQDEFGQIVNDLSSEFMSKASFLFSKGRETLVKGIEMYKDQNMQANDNMPAWMRNQEKYKSENKFEDDDDQDVDVDPNEIKRIIAQRRLKEKERQLEKQRQKQMERERGDNKTSREQVTRRTESLDTVRRPSPEFEPRPQSTNPFDDKRYQQRRPTPTKPQEEPIDLFNPVPSRSQRFKQAEKAEEQQYVSSSRRRPTNNTPSIPSKPSTPKLTRPFVPLNQFQQSDFDKYRTNGNDFFKKGDFTNALSNYQNALQSIPETHDLRILAYSNLSQCHLKVGDAKNSLSDSEKGIALVKDYKKYENWTINGKPAEEFWVKLLSKKAEALEHLEKYRDALDAYNELVENGASAKSTMDGRRRCQESLNPKPKPKPKPKTTPKPVAKPSTFKPENSEVLNRVKDNSAQQDKFEEEKFQMHDEIESRVNVWKSGKEDNLRALLSSLDQILMPGSNWKSVSIADLVLPKKVKIIYMKAISKTHPDKIPQDATTEYKLVAQSIFVVLNQSWDKFKELNGLQ